MSAPAERKSASPVRVCAESCHRRREEGPFTASREKKREKLGPPWPTEEPCKVSALRSIASRHRRKGGGEGRRKGDALFSPPPKKKKKGGKKEGKIGHESIISQVGTIGDQAGRLSPLRFVEGDRKKREKTIPLLFPLPLTFRNEKRGREKKRKPYVIARHS